MAEISERIVSENEGIGVQEAPFCLLCSSEGMPIYQNLHDRIFSVPGKWELRHCQKCGLIWLNPSPLAQEIAKLYSEYSTHTVLDAGPKRLGTLGKAIKRGILGTAFGYNGLLTNRLEKTIGRILSWVGPLRKIVGGHVRWLKACQHGRLLDVGCGNGQFMPYMRAMGWEVMGVEPDGQAVKVARERFGLNVHQGTLEEVCFPDETFDAITMNHVIEHVPDPVRTIRECQRILKKSGQFVVATPNMKSLGHRLFGEAWRGLEVPRHFYVFSPNALRTCAERAGLQVIKIWTSARLARSMWTASYLIRRDGILSGGSPQKQSFGLRLEELAFHAVEHALLWVMNAGEEIVLIATKI